MKKLLFFMMIPSLLFAQTDSPKSGKNEITINAFELVIGGVLPISYERFIDNNQSITVKTFFFDKHYNDFNNGSSTSNSNLFSLQTQYNFYFSEKKQNAGFYFSPFLKYTTGKYTSNYYDYIIDKNGNYVYSNTKTPKNINAVIAGFGLGYKVVLKKKLSLSLTTDIGRVLNQNSYYNNYGPVDFRFGVNTGIRF